MNKSPLGYPHQAKLIIQDNPVDEVPESPNPVDYEFDAIDNTTLPPGFAVGNLPAGASYRERYGRGVITYPTSTAVQFLGIDQAIATSATWEYACKIGITCPHINYYEINMYVRDSVGAKALTFSLDARGAAWKRWTNMTTWNSEGFGALPAGWPTGRAVYMRMKKTSSTNLDFFFSDDGSEWYYAVAVDPSGWLTPNRIGWGGSVSTSAHNEAFIRCYWWRRLA